MREWPVQWDGRPGRSEPNLQGLLTQAFVEGLTELVKKCAGGNASDPSKARAWVQEHADDFFAGVVPDPPRGYVKLCREHNIRGHKEQQRAWTLYLYEGFREPESAAATLALPIGQAPHTGEDPQAVPPDPAPVGQVTSPKPAANMGGDPVPPPRPRSCHS
jgi:hypothetical protein